MLALAKEADVLAQIKGNRPTVLETCENLALHRDKHHDNAHERIETRNCAHR